MLIMLIMPNVPNYAKFYDIIQFSNDVIFRKYQVK